MEILWTEHASDDLQSIVRYVKQQSPQNAEMIFDEIRASVERLSEYPQIGMLPKDTYLSNRGYRMLIVEKYLIFYIVENNQAIIVRIIHGAQKYSHLFE